MNSDGSLILFITLRADDILVTVNGVSLDGSNVFSTLPTFEVWYASLNSGTVEDQKYSIIITPDESHVVTFSTAYYYSLARYASYCRMDIWQITGSIPDFTSPIYSKGENDDNQLRNCRFPTLHSHAIAEDSGTLYTVTIVTEYYESTGPYKTGMLRTYLGSDYMGSSTTDVDEEKVFAGYKFEFTSTYFHSKDLLYAMAVDRIDDKNYLVQFAWDTNSVELYEMRGLSEDPN